MLRFDDDIRVCCYSCALKIHTIYTIDMQRKSNEFIKLP